MRRHTSSGQRRTLLFDASLRALRDEAIAKISNAYAPQGGVRTGAAMLGADGSVAAACSVESTSGAVTLCADRAALGTLLARGVRTFDLLVVASDGEAPAPPCPACRELLAEFAPDLVIVGCTLSGLETRWQLSTHFPDAVTAATGRTM